jgi:predicted XRE-type DNA-binding protein
LSGRIEVEKSSGNVFADLGLPDAEERMTKALLSRAIVKAIKARGLTQIQAAAVLGTTQPKVSDVVRGNLAGFTIDRLIRYLTALNMDVRIAVSPSASAGQTGHVQVELG